MRITFLKNIFSRKKMTDDIKEVVVAEAVPVTADIGDDWVDILIDFCIKTGVLLNEAATAEMVAQAEAVLDFKFPPDFVEFYTRANGFAEWDFIGSMFSLWSLEKIVREYSSGDSKIFIPFCDHSIDVFRIGYLKIEEGVFDDCNQLMPIATTFKETLQLIKEDSGLLYSR